MSCVTVRETHFREPCNYLYKICLLFESRFKPNYFTSTVSLSPLLKGTLKTRVIWSPNANIRVTILRTSQALLQDVTSLLLLLPSLDCCYCCPSIAAAACSTPPLLISILASLFFQRRYGAHAWMLPWNRSSRSSGSFSGLNYVRLTLGLIPSFSFQKH